jgi:DNA-binding IclR family transcriptional regulator
MLSSEGLGLPEEPDDQKYRVPAVQRAFAMLDTLGESSFGLTVRELSQLHKLPYSTCFYLLETMRQCGYVNRDDESKKYSLGHKLLFMAGGGVTQGSPDLRSTAAPILAELVETTRLTGHIAVLDRDEAIYIEKLESPGFIRLHTWVGKRNTLHSSAVGKALIMHAGAEELRRLLPPARLTGRTDRTITTIEGLLSDLAASRSRGYTVDDVEDEYEGRGVAAPVFSAEGRIAGSVGLAGSISQIRREDLEHLGASIRSTAQKISLRMGYIEDLSPLFES